MLLLLMHCYLSRKYYNRSCYCKILLKQTHTHTQRSMQNEAHTKNNINGDITQLRCNRDLIPYTQSGRFVGGLGVCFLLDEYKVSIYDIYMYDCLQSLVGSIGIYVYLHVVF